MNSYPIRLKGADLITVIATVFLIGFFAILPPALKSVQVSTRIREE